MPSFQERNGRWRAEVVRRPRRWSQTFNTKAAARAWALDIEDIVDSGGDPDAPRPETITVGEWEKVWWKARVTEKTTRKSNRSRLDCHVLPAWKTTTLDRVTPMAVQAWVRDLERKKLAAATIASCHHLLSGMMAAAVREGYLRANPCAETQLPRVAPHREVFLTHDEVQRLLDVLEGQNRTIVLCLVLTGMRWGEMAGLRISELDLLRKRLEVIRTMTRYGPKDYPKGGRRRTLPIPVVLVDALAAHLVGRRDRSQLVFTAARGGPLDDTKWRPRVWTKAVTKAGLESRRPRPHDLRHTYASWLVQAGEPLEKVRLLLGHRSITTTQIYAHFAPDHGLSAVSVLDEIAWRTTGVQGSVSERATAFENGSNGLVMG
jgi:integrase